MTQIINYKTVSILTITQYCRFKCLEILLMMIKRQTYNNIIEWVLVEGSQKYDDANNNKENILKFIDENKLDIKFKIIYISYSGKKLGGLRNYGNANCKSDIIVCMDDDDFYPSDRVTEAVTKLCTSSCLISGVSDVYLYNFLIDRLYKFNGFLEYHSTNNCMAYKKEYLLNNSHDPLIEIGEERSFTSEFSIPLVKLNSEKTIIAISHNFNTFNKIELCISCTFGFLNTLVEIKKPITDYIDEDIFLKMKKLYIIEELSKYDIAIIVGPFTVKFDPTSQILNDINRALVNLANYWTNKNKKVVIYGEFDNITINKIDYINWKLFPYQDYFNILILFNIHGLMSMIPFPIKANQIYWDVYDNFINNVKLVEFWKEYGNKVHKIFLKSNFHESEFNHYLGIRNNNQEIYIIPSGLRIDKFSYNIDNVIRNPYRFCYTTTYDRGLEFLIKGVFSVIKKIEPRAELHIYTGFEMINDESYKNKLLDLFSADGVCEHGAQPVEIIVREKYMSSFELYITNMINDVDCISIRESIISGCIPLLANFGVFLERDGYKFDMNHEDKKVMQLIALHILQLMKNQTALLNARKDMKQRCTTLLSWCQVSDLMYDEFIFTPLHI